MTHPISGPWFAFRYSGLYNFHDQKLNVFNGMVSVVDEAVGNLSSALKSRPGVWENTLVCYTHDNGAPLGGGGSNYPLRGGKNSNFEGGVRVPGIIAGGWLTPARRGTTVATLFHVSVWLPTLLSVLGQPGPLSDALSDTIPYDGIDQCTATPDTASLDRVFAPSAALRRPMCTV